MQAQIALLSTMCVGSAYYAFTLFATGSYLTPFFGSVSVFSAMMIISNLRPRLHMLKAIHLQKDGEQVYFETFRGHKGLVKIEDIKQPDAEKTKRQHPDFRMIEVN